MLSPKSFKKCIGVTLFNRIMWVSGVQFYNTPSVYCIVCSPLQVRSPSSTVSPLYPLFYPPLHPASPLVVTMLLSVSLPKSFSRFLELYIAFFA